MRGEQAGEWGWAGETSSGEKKHSSRETALETCSLERWPKVTQEGKSRAFTVLTDPAPRGSKTRSSCSEVRGWALPEDPGAQTLRVQCRGHGFDPRSGPGNEERTCGMAEEKQKPSVGLQEEQARNTDLSLQAPQAGNLGCVWRRGDMEGPPRQGSEKELLYQEKGETSCDPLPATPTGWGR